MNFPGIKPGMTITITRTVSEQETWGNHLPDEMELLLSSAGLAGIMTEAAVRMIDPQLPDGFISVGKSSEVYHEHPTVLGALLRVTVTVTEFDGYHITIAMEAHDDLGRSAHGTHVRSIVNQRWLQLKIARRLTEI